MSPAARSFTSRHNYVPSDRIFLTLTSTIAFAAELSPKDIVANLYQAHRSKHDPLTETRSLSQYFDPELLRLYQKDKREAKGEVGRLDGDPLYNAQEIQITDFSIAPAKTAENEALVSVRFKNLGKSTRVEFALHRSGRSWRISDIRYDDGSSLKKILQAPL